ncbi:hypothetical protein [Microbacterium sp. HA-8]|uniref:hypothetical protein n=2 Tax=Actinomycetes TaxID=1760 RepID=UPI0038F6392B
MAPVASCSRSSRSSASRIEGSSPRRRARSLVDPREQGDGCCIRPLSEQEVGHRHRTSSLSGARHLARLVRVGREVNGIYLKVLTDKTGSLIAAAAQSGLIFAMGPAELERPVVVFGEKDGVAFQLLDGSKTWSWTRIHRSPCRAMIWFARENSESPVRIATLLALARVDRLVKEVGVTDRIADAASRYLYEAVGKRVRPALALITAAGRC